jgi:hypothetical protein
MSKAQTAAYDWVRSRGYAIPAQLVGETVERLARDAGGVVPPRALWVEAEPAEHPLHGMFEWNQRRAADAYRDVQARNVINSLRITDAESGEAAPAFVHYRIVNNEGVAEGYVNSSVIRVNDAARDFALKEALDSLTELESRYKSISELAAVWSAIRQIRRQYV